jgi:hypothetical protein
MNLGTPEPSIFAKMRLLGGAQEDLVGAFERRWIRLTRRLLDPDVRIFLGTAIYNEYLLELMFLRRLACQLDRAGRFLVDTLNLKELTGLLLADPLDKDKISQITGSVET